MLVTSDGSTIIPRTLSREECEASGVAHRRPWSATPATSASAGGSLRHKPKLGLTVNFTPTKRLERHRPSSLAGNEARGPASRTAPAAYDGTGDAAQRGDSNQVVPNGREQRTIRADWRAARSGRGRA